MKGFISDRNERQLPRGFQGRRHNPTLSRMLASVAHPQAGCEVQHAKYGAERSIESIGDFVGYHFFFFCQLISKVSSQPA
jgi:hypothetical protein